MKNGRAKTCAEHANASMKNLTHMGRLSSQISQSKNRDRAQ